MRSLTKLFWLSCLSICVLLGTAANKSWAQSNVLITDDIYDIIAQGYIMKAAVKEINYGHLPLAESPFFKRQIKSAKVAITLVKEGKPSKSFERTIELQPGERLADYFFSAGGHGEKQEASFLFYKDDQGLGSIFAAITSEETKLDTAGRLASALLKGTWKENPVIPVSIDRSGLKYDSDGNLYSYSSRYIIFNSPAGLPGGSIDALQIHKVGYTSGKVTGVIFSHFYGPSIQWHLYNVKYDKNGEIIACSLSWRNV